MDQETSAFLNLIVNQNSPDNNVRTKAELDFNEITKKNPSQSAFILIKLSSWNNQEHLIPLDIKQSCLLHLRRLVPKYWSLGFESFVGPVISQDLKVSIRNDLIQLATSSPESKIRSGSSYVITQIAAADYPDEWPSLLNDLYQLTTNYNNEIAMIGGLTVLNDLFDDLITEEQFWEGGVGNQLINHILQILNQPALSSNIKSNTIKLYQSVFRTLKSPEAFNSQERVRSVKDHVISSTSVFCRLLEESRIVSSSSSIVSLPELNFRSYIYSVLTTFINDFNKAISTEIKQSLIKMIMKDLQLISSIYYDLVVENQHQNFKIETSNDLNDPIKVFKNLIVGSIQTLSSIQSTVHLTNVSDENSLNILIEDLIKCSTLPIEKIEEYSVNIDSFVTDVNELSADIPIRDSINTFLSELNDQDSTIIFNHILSKLNLVFGSDFNNWKLGETYLYLLESLFMNEENENIAKNMNLSELLNDLNKFITTNSNQFIVSRVFLLLPKFFEKFESRLSIKTFGVKSLTDMIDFTITNFSESELVKVSCLISISFYDNLLKLSDLIDKSIKQHIQLSIFSIVDSLIEESEDDSLPVLLEATTAGINIDNQLPSIFFENNANNIINLIFKISFKDSSNVQVNVDSTDCLTSLLGDIGKENFYRICEQSLPFIFEKINSSIGNYEVISDLELSLELFDIIIESSPFQNDFPNEVFNYIFPILTNLMISSNEDQVLRIGSQIFNNLINKASNNFIVYQDSELGQSGIQILLKITERFLLNDLSDNAASNIGLIINSVFEKFNSVLDQNFLSTILEATIKRLIKAEEVITIENITMVFCRLILSSDESCRDLINYLNNFQMLNESTGFYQNGLNIVLPIWFTSFETIRGYEKIKQNILALGKLFTIGSEKIENILVNGDIIPYKGDIIRTRSMTKSMPDKYTQVSSSLKILKLFISELNFQCQQPDADDYLPVVEEGDDEGGWEDMDDIGVPNFEKLKSYVDEDDEDQESDDYDDQGNDVGIKNILTQFFKECTVKNLGNFQKFYELLSEDEKKTIIENVVF